MMRCCSKEKIASKAPKPENVINYICPSKLSKRELEDLYFTLVHNNSELKQTINELSDKIKYQTTKLQRMLTTQRAYMGTETRDCCATVKAIVQEQKLVLATSWTGCGQCSGRVSEHDARGSLSSYTAPTLSETDYLIPANDCTPRSRIVDLKNANENLQEQVKNLNMKLCSTKQFLKRSPVPKHTPTGKAKLQTRLDSAKNSSTSAVNLKRPVKSPMGTKSVSCQYLDSLCSGGSKSPRKPVDTTKNDKSETPNKVCDQNICKTQMKELKEKIVNLQEELSKTHEEYSGRIARLELEVVDLHSENMRVRGEKALWEHDMIARDNEASAIKKKLIETECYCEGLSANLNIEKSKVAELQTQVKAANMTSDAVKTIEDRLCNENTTKGSRRGSVISTRSIVVDNTDLDRNSNLQSTLNSGKTIGLDDNNIHTDSNNQNKVNQKADTSNLKQTPDYGSPGISDNISGQTDALHEKYEADSQRQISPINIYDDNDARREGRREFVGRKDIANTGKSDNSRQISPENIDGDIGSRQERQGESLSRHVTTSTSKAHICRQMSPDNIFGDINGDRHKEHDCGSHNNSVSNTADNCRQTSSINISRDTPAYHKKHDCGSHNNTDSSGKLNTRSQINPGDSDNTSADIDSRQEKRHECGCFIDTANTANTRPQVCQDIVDPKSDFDRNESPNASRRENTNRWDNTGSSSFAPENDDVIHQTGQNTAVLQGKQHLSANSRKLHENIDTDPTDTHPDNRQITTASDGKIGSKNDCNTCQNNDVDKLNSDNNQNVTFDRQDIVKPTNNSQEIKNRTSVVPRDINKFLEDCSNADNRQQNKEYHSDGTSRVVDLIREFDGHDIVNNRNENNYRPGETSQVNKVRKKEDQETVNKRQGNRDRHPSSPPRDLDKVHDIRGPSNPPNRQENKTRRASLRNTDIICWNDSDDRAYNRQNFPKTDCTTEYRSQFNDSRRLSPDLQSPLASPSKTQTRKPMAESQFLYGTEVIPEGEEKMKTSPVMSQLVNKSNESSCYCSGQCQCVKSMKNIPPSTGSVPTKPATSDVSTDAKTPMVNAATELDSRENVIPWDAKNPLVNASTEPDSRENVIPLTPEEQVLMRKFMSLFTYTPTELGEPQSSRKPLAETSEQSAVNTSSAKTADDSGYADVSAPSEQEKGLMKINQELGKKITEMQAQLDDLKSHMLTRKNTYTVFKDDATSVTDSVRKPGNEIGKTKNPCPSKVSGSQTQNAQASRDSDETKLDSKRVVLKIPKKGYVIIQQDPEEQKYQVASNSKKHDASGPFDTNVSCETTCGREGLSCTKECMLKNKNNKPKYSDIKKETQNYDDDKKYSDVKKDVKRKDGDKRYEIPGPIAMDYESKKTQPDNIFSDIPVTESFGHPTSYPTEQKGAGVPRQFDKNKYETDSTSPNTNFYEGYSTGVRQNTCCIKTESPPTNRTQNINIKDTSINPRILEGNINTQYVKETQVIPNAHTTTKIWNEPNIRESPNYTITENSTATQLQKDITEPTKNLNLKEDCCTRHQRLLEPVVISKPVKNTSVGAKDVTVHCACRAAKKIPVKCMCPPHSEYTTNVVHTSTTPITSPNQEGLNPCVSSKSNAENALSSNAQQYNLQVKNNVPVANVANLQNFDNTRPGTENKRVAETATFDTLIDNVERMEEFKKVDVVDKPKRRLTKFEHNLEHWDTKVRGNENKGQENTITMSEKAQLFRERSMSEANKIHRDIRFDRKFVEPIDEHRCNVKTNLNDDRRENRFITNFRENRYEDRYGDKSNDGEVNNKDLTQKENIQENDPAKQIAKNNSKIDLNENKIQKERYGNVSLDKTKQTNSESRFVDINDRERRFVDNNTGGEINNADKNTMSDMLNSDKTQKDLSHYFQQAKAIPVATSSPFNSATKLITIDKATDNQLGTQLSDCDGDKGTEPKTYIIEASADFVTDKNQKDVKYARVTSPENTDQEISSLTDLPSEKETTTTPSQTPRYHKCARYSLGEDKVTTTKSDSPTLPTSSSQKTTTFSLSEGEPKTLSEGEMPEHSAAARKRARGVNIDPTRNEIGGGSAEKVEQALASISEELARCRLLLQKPKEAPTQRLKDLIEVEKHNSKDGDKERFEAMKDRNRAITQSLSPQGSSHALRKSKAKQHIGNGPDTPHVMFTLHIGTVVLSDEAVINSRNLSLVLTWKFYDQNVAMSHMRPDRVVHFDFSTEYDLKLTDQFLQYLKTEELQIKLCEVHKLDAPLASCSLPLREALLHTNRRADMSLALVAGPQMQRSAPAADTLDTRDEMGVLDLWCMLRAEPRIVPLINQAIAKSRPSRLPDDGSRQHSLANSPLSPLIMQLDDDQDEVHLSADLDQTFHDNDRLPVTDSKNLIDRGAYNQTTLQMQQDRKRISNYGYVNVSESGNKRNLNNQPFTQYPALKSKNPPEEPQDKKADDPSQGTKFASRPSWNTGDTSTKRSSSGYIINEVPACIKSDEHMKQAITEEEAQSKTQPEPRVSYGDISIPSLRNPRNISTVTNNPEINSMGLGLSNYSLNKYWHGDDDIIKQKRTSGDQMQKKLIETGPSKDAGSIVMEQPEARTCRFDGSRKALESFKSMKTKKISPYDQPFEFVESQARNDKQDHIDSQTVVITILWLALNEECSAMNDPSVQRLYVAYSFLGRSGAELETPVSLPKPKQYQDKCYFNFKKSFHLSNMDLDILGHMAQCRSPQKGKPNSNDSVVFTVVSEPVEDPLGLNNCEDIGFAHLYFGDLIAFSAGSDSYTEVIPIHDCRDDGSICGVLSIRVDGLDVVRNSLAIVSNGGRY